MKEIAPGVFQVPTSFVNAYLIGLTGGRWILVDTGLPGFAWKVRAAAAERFGRDSRPDAIVLTHGHFDHAGNARQLADRWGTPIYAHRLELPYLTGRSDYPPPDPTVGGCIAQMSRFLPHGSTDLGTRLRELPPAAGERAEGQHGIIPGADGWRWLHTPGHSPGHVAFFRESDSTLLAGDAFATVDLDSYIGFAAGTRGLFTGGSPFICDWDRAERSVNFLASLRPKTVGCGHGKAFDSLAEDENLPDKMASFARSFARPTHGRYVEFPAQTDERGVDALPAKPADPGPVLVTAAGAGLALALLIRRKRPGVGL